MKLMLIFCDASLEERILDGLRRIGVSGYSRLAEVTGLGRSGRRDGDPIWPGSNSLVIVGVPDSVEPVREFLQRLKQEYSIPPALHVFSVESTELL